MSRDRNWIAGADEDNRTATNLWIVERELALLRWRDAGARWPL